MDGCPTHGTEFLKSTEKSVKGNYNKTTYCAAVVSTSMYGGKPLQELCMWHPDKNKPVQKAGDYKCSVCGKLTGTNYSLCTEHSNLYSNWYSQVKRGKMTKDELKNQWEKLRQSFKKSAA